VTHRHWISLPALLAAWTVAGCNKQESPIRSYEAPKDIPSPQVFSQPQIASDVPDQNNLPPMRWTLPAGWKQAPTSDAVQYARFQISAQDPAAELTVVPMPPQNLLPNLIRWAGQLKLPPVSEADVPKYVTQTQVSGEEGQLVDMTGSAQSGNPPARLLSAIIPHENRSWIFKLKGPEPVVAAQKSNFMEFLHSIQFTVTPDTQTQPTEPGQSPGAPSQSLAESYRLTKWTTPDGWQEQPGSNAMRVTSFRIGAGTGQAELIVSRIRQGQTGGFLENVNRWRGQVGLEPVSQASPNGMQSIEVAGQPAMLLSLTGPPNGAEPPMRLDVAIAIEGNEFWYFKMLGPEPVVLAHQNAFRQFLSSLQFKPESH